LKFVKEEAWLFKEATPIRDLIVIKNLKFLSANRIYKWPDSIKNKCQITVNTPQKGAW